jgi:hypothetical protein
MNCIAQKRGASLPRLGTQLLLAALLCTACTPEPDADKSIRRNVAEFYRLQQAAPPSGALSLSELMTYRPLLSVALFEQLKDASVAEEAHFAQNADKAAPLFEGNLFTARTEGFAATQVLDCAVDDDKASCNIELNAAETKPAVIRVWKERIFLSSDSRGWMIDDIDFGNQPAPMRHGRLSALLRAGIERGRAEAAH